MSKTTQRIIVLLCALALIVPFGIMGIGQLSGGNNEDKKVADSAQDTRATVDPATQPQPTNTTAPEQSSFDNMNESTAAGAQATADYLFAVYAYMIATGDTTGWDALSAPECQECQAFSQNSLALHQAGGWIVGGEITLSDKQVELTTVGQAKSSTDTTATNTDATAASTLAGNDSDPYATITATFNEAAAQLVDDPTREAVSRDASTGTFSVSMRHDGSRWLITSMKVN